MPLTREVLSNSKNKAILKVRNLKTYFYTRHGVVKAVDDINFEVQKGKCLCLVGESGCGKTVTALSILGLIDSPPGKVVGGEILYQGLDLLKCSAQILRSIRGKEIAIIFQDAQSALNPVFTISEQITEQIKHHLKLSNVEAKERTLGLLKEVGIPSPERVMYYYPHQLSGGMKQRVMIAMSLSCDPQLLIADEPTTAVDVTIKAQIIDILKELKERRQLSLIFITHDLSTVTEIGDRIVVMYAGRVAESGTVTEISENPKHPYTRGLIDCLPDFSATKTRLPSIPGTIPSFLTLPEGCLFHPRCSQMMEICKREIPTERIITEKHFVSCHLYS